MRGPDVQRLQELLNLQADGIYGPGTERAVREYQKRNGLTADGIVDPATWNLLNTRKAPGTEKNTKEPAKTSRKPTTKPTTQNKNSIQIREAIAQQGEIVISNYQKRGVKYSQSQRKTGIDTQFADCSSTVRTILESAGAGEYLKGTHTRAMRSEIESRGGILRKENPIPGDLMLWGGHVTVVTRVENDAVQFAHMGNSGARIGRVNLKNGRLDREATWGAGGFLGFHTLV
jgi:hypothetical protein